MPRSARKHAESGIYHVMLRGIDRQLLFEDSEDYFHFMDILQQCREVCGFELYAYCLMGNHVHLLLKEGIESLESVFKRIGGRYVYYYNVKYQRLGHLFQDRYKSEPVEDTQYFMTVLRYIHQNPVKAKLCRAVEDYPYSSYGEYLTESIFVDTAFALGVIPREAFASFHREPNSDRCLEIMSSERKGVTDEQAKKIIEKYAHCTNIVAFQSLDEKKKERNIKRIYEKGLSIRQISRLTGTTKGMVEKYLKS